MNFVDPDESSDEEDLVGGSGPSKAAKDKSKKSEEMNPKVREINFFKKNIHVIAQSGHTIESIDSRERLIVNIVAFLFSA